MKKIKYKELSIPLQNYIGVDEVGRGCLAGPVVSSAVYIKKLKLAKLRVFMTQRKFRKLKERNYILK